ncbi:helix-turn-helix transcriptional regulator [Aestuariicoccus sp. MJ-SS9]|uniref:helix-turn-helix transcriptional regulator n=1 Tax=Aestuariicoccus sp. MJ-SS9 TaxID=3079855 RepID=UPI002913F8C4|nr:AlpA family phage regulatory protein [Aestuariicoccus sp. MJ-SS9]MDU8911679.1 AlpA family phage regulatory protein [Aestuariicoccus sp. MJ-SS9]
MVDTFLTDTQIAERFGVHRLTVWRWHREDETFPRAYRLSERCTRWKLSELIHWETTRAQKGEA